LYAFYRKPNSNLTDFFDSLELILSKNMQETLIFGDFNIDISKDTDIALRYTHTLTSYNYYICNTIFPTRVTSNTSSLIDHIITNRTHISGKISNIDDPLSDHNILILNYENSMKKLPNNRSARNLSNAHKVNYQKLNSLLKTCKFTHSSEDVNKNYNNFNDFLLNAINSCKFKLKTNNGDKRLNNTPWFDAKLDILNKKTKQYI